MTQDEIIELARQAGFSDWAIQTPNDFIAFAKLVAEAEREACAEVCDDIHAEHEVKGANWCGDEIRARGQA